MTFKSKVELIQFIKHQTNIELKNGTTYFMNKPRKYLYTEVDRTDKYSIFPLLNKHGIRYEQHTGNNYFIYIK